MNTKEKSMTEKVELHNLRRQLLDREEINKTLIELIPDIVYKIDPDGKFTFINNSIERIGYTPEELIGKHFSEIIHPDDMETISREIILHGYEGGITGYENAPKLFYERRSVKRKIKNLEIRVLSKSSKKKKNYSVFSYGEVSSARHYDIDESGKEIKYLGTVGIISDISIRKKAEEKLKKYREHLEEQVEERTKELKSANEELKQQIIERDLAIESYRKEKSRVDQIIELNPYAIGEADGEGHSIRANKAFIDLFGTYPPEGYSIFDDPLLKKGGFSEKALKVKEGRVVKLPENWYNPHDLNPALPDKLVCIYTILFPIMNKSGEIENIIFMYENITERKSAEEMLRKSEMRFKEIANLLPTIVCELNEKYVITYINRAGFKTFGYKKADIEKGLKLLDIIHPDDRKRAVSDVARVLQGKHLKDIEYRALCRDTTELIILASSSPIYKNEEIVGLRNSISNISERKRLEKEVLKVCDRTQRKIGQDLHDSIFSQLCGISMLGQVLEEELREKALGGEADKAQNLVSYLEDAIEQTRKIAKGLYPVKFETKGLMSALLELTSITEALFNMSCIFRCEKPVLIDNIDLSTNLFRIVQEALNNAFKHGEAKHTIIELSTEPKGMVRLSVKDDGGGFPTDWEKTRGMGLYIMEHRAKMIGSYLEINREEKKWTTINCFFRNKK